MKNICEECAFQCICEHECKEKNLHNNYVSKEKIREKINYLESQFDEGIENYNNQFIIDCVGILDELLEGE